MRPAEYHQRDSAENCGGGDDEAKREMFAKKKHTAPGCDSGHGEQRKDQHPRT